MDMKRRMITTDVTSEGKFLRMSLTAQALWMHLLANADDDGCVDAYTIMRMVGAKEDDLVLLKERGYITVLDEKEFILWITNFQSFNWLDARYKEDSKHLPLLLSIVKGIEITKSEKNKYKKVRSVNRKEKIIKELPERIAHVQHRGSTGDALAKVRLGKVSIIKTNIHTDSSESLDILSYWNDQFGQKRVKVTFGNNLAYWLETYTVDDIKKAINQATKDEWWLKVAKPDVFFRQTGTDKEPVDRIGDMLSKATTKRRLIEK